MDDESVSCAVIGCASCSVLILLTILGNLQVPLMYNFLTVLFIVCSFVCVLYLLCACFVSCYDYCKVRREFANYEEEPVITLPPVKVQTIIVIQNPEHISLGYKYESPDSINA